MTKQITCAVAAVAVFLPMSLFAQSTDDCSIPRTELSRDALTSCFGAEVAADQDILTVVAPIWQSFDDGQKGAAVDRYRAGMPADASIVLDTYPRTAATMRILHAEAITIGEQEFLANMQQDPELDGLTDEDFIAYRDEILNDFLDGTDNSTLNEFVTYAPAFTEYVLTFPADFVFAEDMKRTVNIAETQASITEQKAIRAEQFIDNMESLGYRPIDFPVLSGTVEQNAIDATNFAVTARNIWEDASENDKSEMITDVEDAEEFAKQARTVANDFQEGRIDLQTAYGLSLRARWFAEQNALQAEQSALQAEYRAQTAALQRLQNALQGNFD